MFRTARQFVPRTRASFLRHAPRQAATNVLERSFSGSRVLRCAESEAMLNEPREVMEYDVLIVGAGPAGLSAAIKLKQLAMAQDRELDVCVVEKGSEVGAHILSGNCFQPTALDELLPEWRESEIIETFTEIKEDRFYFLLSDKMSVPLPPPPFMNNHGNFIISLSQLVRWLGERAEEMGVEIYPGFAASEVLYNSDGTVEGIATGDVGIAKDGSLKDSFARGMELKAKQTLFAEGCRGSCSKQIINKFDLRKDSSFQTYGLGLKEIWQLDPSKHFPGLVQHTAGYPVDGNTWGGSWMYHMKEDNMLSIGYVVGLDYSNPYLSPYQEFQKFKQHPLIRETLEGGQVVYYGARTLNEGGFQSIPKLTFPGGALVGCSAGFLNVPKVKGTHTAMKSGMLAAEAAYDAVTAETPPTEIFAYSEKMKASWVWDELKSVRNIRPAFKFGLIPFLAYSALEGFILKGRVPWTFQHHGEDHLCTQPAAQSTPINYPKPDGKVSFELLNNLALSGTNHDHDQPAHLKLIDSTVPTSVNLPKFDGPEGRFCPARVYEYVEQDGGDRALQINAQNCLHCKACDIKDPTQNINWTVPEGAGGPAYTLM